MDSCKIDTHMRNIHRMIYFGHYEIIQQFLAIAHLKLVQVDLYGNVPPFDRRQRGHMRHRKILTDVHSCGRRWVSMAQPPVQFVAKMPIRVEIRYSIL